MAVRKLPKKKLSPQPVARRRMISFGRCRTGMQVLLANGGHLSVGQRQRIGIARAFLKNAPILLLDEPTSALDPKTESAIMETIKELMRGRTTFIATHRLATIHNVDQIVVLEGGRIIEKGRGPELVARGGVYAKLYSSGNFPS